MSNTTNVRDVNWIKSALQNALELEFSTLPLYLSSMFSLEVQNYSAYNTVRSVAMEEMVHMAIVANILSAIGGTPVFKTMQVSYPTKGLPGGAEPDLFVGLSPYSKNQIKNFMRIEMPDFLVKELNLHETYQTISKFYADIKAAILDNANEINALVKKGGTSNQVGDNIGFPTFIYQDGIDSVKMLCDGIDEILEQGEGASANDLITNSEFEMELSHYAKFAELFYGATYQKPSGIDKITLSNEPEFFKGLPISFPEVINTLSVPKDGYAKILALDPNGAEIKTELEKFDAAFSTMLDTLDVVWNGPASTSWKSLGAAVHGMVDFRVLSCFMIMRSQIPVDIIKQLPTLYPNEFEFMSLYTDLSKPVFYGPRFLNTNT